MPDTDLPPDQAPAYAAARQLAVLFHQPGRGKVEVVGRDAGRFLHNLCSNDIVGLAPGAGCETFLATAKARLVAHLFVFRSPAPADTSFWLDVPAAQTAAAMAHLDRYLISEQVELADRAQELVQLHLAGPQAAELLERALGITPPAVLRMIHLPPDAGGLTQVRRRDILGIPGFDLLGPQPATDRLVLQLADQGAHLGGPEVFEVLRIEAGLPLMGPDLDDTTFVPEAGRTPQAISYTKGCYLGQEPIVMARDRGQINRTLRGLRLPAGPVAPGSLLQRDGKEAGRCLSSTYSPRLGVGIALALVRRGSWDPGTALEVETPAGRQPAHVVELPFTGPAAATGS